MQIFRLSASFPKKERYSLTDQIRRSSRSIPANLREGFAKRRFPNVFARHITDAFGSAEETRTWLDFSRDSGYLTEEQHRQLEKTYDGICAMLFRLQQKWT